MSGFMAFDVGCLECGESSGIIGFFGTEEEAEAACVKAAERQDTRWSGQHSMEVFPIDSRSRHAKDPNDG